MVDRKALIRDYKETARPAGLFVVRNLQSGMRLVGSTPDLPGMLNRQRFQLEMGSHPDKGLQSDWNELGSDAFTIEVLDELEIPEEGSGDVTEDLHALKQVWLEKLVAEGTPLYAMSSRGK